MTLRSGNKFGFPSSLLLTRNMTMLRRALIGSVLLWLALAGSPVPVVAASTQAPLRIGLTPVVVREQQAVTVELQSYLERNLGRPVELVWRASHRRTTDLMARGKLDFAWLSVPTYVHLKRNYGARLVATPLFEGRPQFRAYFIVRADDQTTRNLLQLEGRFFAYSDPYSLTGYFLPRQEIHATGRDPDRFFARSFFTMSRAKLIKAVASGLADGSYVDSHVWRSMARTDPALLAQTRVVAETDEVGLPPLVAGAAVKDRDIDEVRRVLITMAEDPRGRALLERLGLDGFVAGDPAWYADAERTLASLGER